MVTTRASDWLMVTGHTDGGINIIIGGHPCQGVGLSAPTLEREHSDQSEGVWRVSGDKVEWSLDTGRG